MRRRSFITFLGSTIVMGSFTAYARQSGGMRRIGVLMSYPEYRSRRTDVARCVPRGTPETRLDRGPTAFFNSPIERAICHRRNQVVRHSTQVGRKYCRPRRKHFGQSSPPRKPLSGSGFQHSQNNFFDAWGKENKVLQLASAQEKPFCAILEITVFLAFLDRVELFN